MSRTTVITALAASAALAAGFLLPAEAYLGVIALLVLIGGGAIALAVQFEHPLLGLALLVVTAVVFPVEFRGPAAGMVSSSLPLAAFVCAVWLLRSLVVRGSVRLESTRAVYAVVALMAVTLLSFGSGQLPWYPSEGAPLPAQAAELSLFLLSGCLFLAVGYQIRSVSQLQWLMWLFVAAGVLACVLQMVPALRPIARMTSRPGSVGSLFWTWLVALSFAQAVFNRRLVPIARLALVGVTALVLFHGLVQVRSWASGWVPTLTALGVIVLFRIPRVTIGAGLAAVPVALFLAASFSSVLLQDEQYSLLTRQEAWATLWQLIERSPLLGTGPANYYYYTENFSILGWYVRFISHNNYQDLLVQTGFLGLLAFCWFAFEVFLLTLRQYRRATGEFERAYAAGAIGGLAGSLVAGMLGDWIIPFYYNAGILGFRSSLLFWVFLGGVLALRRMSSSARHAEAVVPQRAYAPGARTLAQAH